jgi:ribosomal subunit interface protein
LTNDQDIMKTPAHIQFHGLQASDALTAAAQQKLEKLNRFCDDILSCRIDIEQLARHQQQGRPFGVRIHLSLPGRELTVDGAADEDAHLALRDAFDRMTRQLQDTVRRSQAHAPRPIPE